ncbi:MAG: glutamate--tRNA ligase [Candidatus Nezhaarchaeota archaeon]|nr:glutamate--tRNA ligase [Candidatus Nezhaarchaeota archaeon]
MSFPEDVVKLVKKHAYLNAYEHGGKASQGPVLGKILAERPELRSKVKELVKLVAEVIDEVNGMGFAEVKNKVETEYPEALSKKREAVEKVLPPLPNVDKYKLVVTRFAPNPDAPLHLGSLRPLIISYEYARAYKGKFILRFDDTDPKTKKPMPEAYEWIKDDMSWLGIKPDQVIYQSDRLEIYYDVARRLLELGGAYVCTCSAERFKALRDSGKPCPCRELDQSEQLARFEGMLLRRYGEKEAVVRVKTDLNHPDMSVREWVALRVIDVEGNPHPRVGDRYFVWPTYNFACAVDDYLLEVSHILRAKEHVTNTVKQRYIFEYMKWRFPEAIHFGRLKLANIVLSKSQISRGIAKGEFLWWDDPRLGTIMAVRRRGILPETLKEVILHVGVKTSEASLSWENIYSINRRHLDPKADRYFCVLDPVLLIVEGAPGRFVARPPLHPDYPERGFRELEVRAEDCGVKVYISRRDVELFKGKNIVRLMSLFNVESKEIVGDTVYSAYRSECVEDASHLKAPIIQWVPLHDNVDVEVMMPNAAVSRGVGEASLSNLEVNSIIQFVRVGFARLDEKGKGRVRFYFAHE